MAPDATCRLCERIIYDASFVADICKPCAETIRMRPMPPPRRRAAPCVRCNGLRFARTLPRDYSGEFDYPNPMTVAQPPRVEARVLRTGKSVYRPDPNQGLGSLETYTCLGCGLVEWYCHDPENIPIGPEHMTDLVDYTPDKPYR